LRAIELFAIYFSAQSSWASNPDVLLVNLIVETGWRARSHPTSTDGVLAHQSCCQSQKFDALDQRDI